MKKTVICIFLAALMGCTTVDVTKTAKGFYEATDANEVEILKTIPSKRYIELGTVTASGFSVTDSAKMHNAIRNKAAQLGANAVVLTEQGMLPGGLAGPKQWVTGVALHYE